MEQKTKMLLFSLIRSSLSGIRLSDEERSDYSHDLLKDLIEVSSKHDIAHLVVLGLKQNDLLSEQDIEIKKIVFKAAYRYESLNYEYENLCDTLQKTKIPFLPLKGAVIRQYYPEEWMRTSGDIDVLIHEEDVEKTANLLVHECGYEYVTKDLWRFADGSN